MSAEQARLAVFGRRALVLGAAKLGLFGLLAGRLYQLQVVEAEQYTLLADDNRVDQRLVLPVRGRILDRSQRVMAHNRPSYSVVAIPERIAELDATLADLAALIALPAFRIEAVLAESRGRPAFWPLVVQTDLAWWEVSKVAVNAYRLPGIRLETELVRDYPAGEAGAQVVGHVGAPAGDELTEEPVLAHPGMRIGKKGVERAFDREVRGSAGIARFEVNARGRELRLLQRIEGEPGADLALTLDLELQRFLHRRLEAEESASGVVIDVRSGALLALDSAPAFDPGLFARPLPAARWRALADDPRAPLLNKAIGGHYPPGSTFKMITALAALEARVINADHRVSCNGRHRLGRQTFHCWKRQGHGALALTDALAQSCDVYFYDLAARLGLGRKLGLDIPGEQPGLVPDRAWKQEHRGAVWQRGETLVVGIGQGYLATTPLQLAVMTALIANGGRPIVPHLRRRSVSISLS
jgi:penicillin-binding protein 2